MSATESPSAEKKYAVALVCRVWSIPRSTFYGWKSEKDSPRDPCRRRAVRGDGELLAKIKSVLANTEADLGLVGEGHRKVWARLRHRGVRTSKRRVLRLMRENDLLAPTRVGSRRGPRNHDGSIHTQRPDEMWGTDFTTTILESGQSVAVFVAVDHCTGECIGIHASESANRFEALEPIRQGVVENKGGIDKNIAAGLQVRHDHGSQYMSHVFQNELEFLGIESSPSYVRAPQGNGVAERFIRVLKEQLLWLRTFEGVESLRLALHDFRKRYNENWLLGRHNHRTPQEVRRSFASNTPPPAIAA